MFPLAAAHSRLYYPAGSNVPPLPSTAGAVLIAGLFNLAPETYSGPALHVADVNTDEHNATYLFTAPYGVDWDDAGSWSPPVVADTWYDQLGENNLVAESTARPTLDATNHLISFDGVANGIRGIANLYAASQTGSIYLDFQPLSLAAGSRVIFETGGGTVDSGARISIAQVANVLSCSIFDTTIGVAQPNTKAWTIPNTNRIFVCFQFDTTQGTAANQTALFINNSSTGVTSIAAADCNGLDIGNGRPNVGARNNAASNFFTGNMWQAPFANDVVDDAAARLVQFNYNQYLKSLAPL